MTKAEWISVIKHTLTQVDESGMYREPLLERHIQSVYEQMYTELYLQQRSGISKYTTLITQSSASDQNMTDGITISTLPISLPRINGGLFEFYIGSTTFVLTSYEGYKASVSSHFDTAGVKGSYLATVLKDKIYANTTTGGSVGTPATLTFRMIPKFTSLASTDQVMIPGAMEDHFIDRVIDTIRHLPPPDLINDNTIS